MIRLAVAAARSAPYELYAHMRSLQLGYGLDSGQIVELAAPSRTPRIGSVRPRARS
jgi:hypothetical protein